MAKKDLEKNPFDPRSVVNGETAGQGRLRLGAKAIVCRQGDSADRLFYVEDGLVTTSVVSASGREAVTGVRGRGDFFGIRSLLGGNGPLGSATALTACVVIYIKIDAMRRLLREESGFAEWFIGFLIKQHIRDHDWLIDQLTNSAEKRLAQILLRLSAAGGPTRIDQTTLANMVGTTRSRVSSFMSKFRQRGFIEYDRHSPIKVHHTLHRIMLAS